MRITMWTCAALLVVAMTTIPSWLAAAPPSEKLPTKGLHQNSENVVGIPDEELLPPIKIQARSNQGSLGILMMGDRQVQDLQVLRGEIMSMVGSTGPDEGGGYEVAIEADADLKMAEVVKIFNSTAGYRDRSGGYHRLIGRFRLEGPTDKRDLRRERAILINSVNGGT